MSAAMVFGMIMAGVVCVPVLGLLGMWWHDRYQETRCQRGLHEWGYWRVRLRAVSTVLGLRDVMASACERGCGARVRHLVESPDEVPTSAPLLAERLFREARS